ncbi:MAG TPA: hypothetical protein VFZ24_12490 [Longimicrobiales bacterium]
MRSDRVGQELAQLRLGCEYTASPENSLDLSECVAATRHMVARAEIHNRIEVRVAHRDGTNITSYEADGRLQSCSAYRCSAERTALHVEADEELRPAQPLQNG